jgi:hypothetical protein
MVYCPRPKSANENWRPAWGCPGADRPQANPGCGDRSWPGSASLPRPPARSVDTVLAVYHGQPARSSLDLLVTLCRVGKFHRSGPSPILPPRDDKARGDKVWRGASMMNWLVAEQSDRQPWASSAAQWLGVKGNSRSLGFARDDKIWRGTSMMNWLVAEESDCQPWASGRRRRGVTFLTTREKSSSES